MQTVGKFKNESNFTDEAYKIKLVEKVISNFSKHATSMSLSVSDKIVEEPTQSQSTDEEERQKKKEKAAKREKRKANQEQAVLAEHEVIEIDENADYSVT